MASARTAVPHSSRGAVTRLARPILALGGHCKVRMSGKVQRQTVSQVMSAPLLPFSSPVSPLTNASSLQSDDLYTCIQNIRIGGAPVRGAVSLVDVTGRWTVSAGLSCHECGSFEGVRGAPRPGTCARWSEARPRRPASPSLALPRASCLEEIMGISVSDCDWHAVGMREFADLQAVNLQGKGHFEAKRLVACVNCRQAHYCCAAHRACLTTHMCCCVLYAVFTRSSYTRCRMYAVFTRSSYTCYTSYAVSIRSTMLYLLDPAKHFIS